MGQPFGADDFRQILESLADAWARNDANAGATLFQQGAIYMEPPDVQLFIGRDELRAYFSPLEPGTYLDIHHSWFDEASGLGAAEYSFGIRGRDQASHGVAIVEIVDRLIATWREYQAQGPGSFSAFIATGGKQWTWHIGNYP